MAGCKKRGTNSSPRKHNKGDTPSSPARENSKDRKGANARPDGTATQNERLKRKRSTSAGPTSANVDLPEGQPQDPFRHLSSVEVGLVIEFLPVESTHTLRLVSKLWKACSEYHNGALAIRRHFPHSTFAKRTYETRDEANLQFRRLCEHLIIFIVF